MSDMAARYLRRGRREGQQIASWQDADLPSGVRRSEQGRDEVHQSVSNRVVGTATGDVERVRPARSRPRNPAADGDADPHCRLKAGVGRVERSAAGRHA
jgi:hypothetical protein